ncbi:hypothetical protein [Alcaligenes sp. 13f]|nr:hypothetical protein [Alcaligenes sp. 13f]
MENTTQQLDGNGSQKHPTPSPKGLHQWNEFADRIRASQET